MYGLSRLPGVWGAGLIGLGALGVVLFMAWESRSRHPVLELNLFRRSRAFAFSNLAALINYSATFAVTFYMSLYFQYIRSYSPLMAGLALMPQFVLQMLVSPFAGRLSDRMEPRILASLGMGLTVLGLALLTVISATTPLWYLITCLVLLGVGFGIFSSPNTNAIMSAVDRRYLGIASAMNGSMRVVGTMLSMGIAMTIIAITVGQVEITPEYYNAFIGSIQVAFLIFTLLCIAGIGASLVRGRTRKHLS